MMCSWNLGFSSASSFRSVVLLTSGLTGSGGFSLLWRPFVQPYQGKHMFLCLYLNAAVAAVFDKCALIYKFIFCAHQKLQQVLLYLQIIFHFSPHITLAMKVILQLWQKIPSSGYTLKNNTYFLQLREKKLSFIPTKCK